MKTLPHSISEAVRLHALHRNPAPLRFARCSEPITYAELWRHVEAKLQLLAAVGFAPGQRVALSMSNTLHTVSSVLAVMHAGGTLIPLFYRQGMRPQGRDFERILATLRVSRAPLVLTHDSELPTLQEAARSAGGYATVHAYEREAPAHAPAPCFAASADGLALIQFSAGSTSEPKGLGFGHAQLVTNVAGIGQRLALQPQDVWCSWLPLFHDMGLVGALFSTLYAGAGLSLFTPSELVRTPLSWIEQLSIDRATITVAPQFAYDLVLQKLALVQPADDAYALSSLRLALNGAEAVDVAVCDEIERAFARFGLREHTVQPCYGLAENCVAVTVRRPGSPRIARCFERAALDRGQVKLQDTAARASVTRAGNGFAVEGTQFLVMNAQHEPVPDGQVGEVAISGGATARVVLRADGSLAPLPQWVRTGDLGVVLDGELFIVGRVKEIVKRGGETFAPTDIEACAAAAARAADQRVRVVAVAAFGFRDDTTHREEIVLLAETRDYRHAEASAALSQQLRVAVLREFRLPLYDVLIARPGTIPRTTSGKTQRLLLRERYLRGELTPQAAADGQAVHASE